MESGPTKILQPCLVGCYSGRPTICHSCRAQATLKMVLSPHLQLMDASPTAPPDYFDQHLSTVKDSRSSIDRVAPTNPPSALAMTQISFQLRFQRRARDFRCQLAMSCASWHHRRRTMRCASLGRPREMSSRGWCSMVNSGWLVVGI